MSNSCVVCSDLDCYNRKDTSIPDDLIFTPNTHTIYNCPYLNLISDKSVKCIFCNLSDHEHACGLNKRHWIKYI